MDLKDYRDVEILADPIVQALESIAGSLMEIRANAEAIVANGVDINVTIHIGGRPEQ